MRLRQRRGHVKNVIGAKPVFRGAAEGEHVEDFFEFVFRKSPMARSFCAGISARAAADRIKDRAAIEVMNQA